MSPDRAVQLSRPRTGFPYLDAVLDQPGAVLAFAHRGGSLHPEIVGAENTVQAFRHAVSLGYRYLETDVHATTDGVLVAFHDDALDRMTDRTGLVGSLTSAEVALARIGGRHEVPTMAGLLEEFPQCRFNIDIKSTSAVAPLAALIEATAAWDRVLVGAFSHARLQEFRRLTAGRVATSAVPVEAAAFRALPLASLARAATRSRVAALQVPRRRGPLTVVTPALVRRAHAAGVQVHVWTIDDQAELHELLDLGVDGIFTDRTDVLKDVLLARGQWLEQQ